MTFYPHADTRQKYKYLISLPRKIMKKEHRVSYADLTHTKPSQDNQDQSSYESSEENGKQNRR